MLRSADPVWNWPNRHCWYFGSPARKGEEYTAKIGRIIYNLTICVKYDKKHRFIASFQEERNPRSSIVDRSRFVPWNEAGNRIETHAAT